MATDPRHAVLFEPVTIGPKTLRNRFYKTPHCSNFGIVRPRTQAAFRAMAAEGGWAACNTEMCSIHPSSDAHPYSNACLWDESDVLNLSLLCDKLHEHNSLAGVELWYGGVHAATRESRLKPWGVSPITQDFQSCVVMDTAA